MISVSDEKSKVRPSATTMAKPRGALKPCPIQPCPSEISVRALTCKFHWSLCNAPEQQNRAGSGAGLGDHWEWVYAAVTSLVQIASRLEEGGVPLPWEAELRRAAFSTGGDVAIAQARKAVREKAAHDGRFGCRCDWCGPLTSWAIKTLSIAPESWQKALIRYG